MKPTSPAYILLPVLLSISIVTCALANEYDNLYTEQSENLVVGLAISGGGFRSAAFAYGAMKKLNHTYLCIVSNNDGPKSNDRPKNANIEIRHLAIVEDKRTCLNSEPKSILDSVKIISAVSGGALPALYYKKYGKAAFLENGDNFGNKVLTLPDKLEKDQVLQNAVPWWLTALDLLPFVPGAMMVEKAVTGVLTRTGLLSAQPLADLLDREVFASPPRVNPHWVPEVLIHTTNISKSRLFTLDASDLRCIDSANLSPGQMVAMTAALPGLVEPWKFEPRILDTDTGYDSCATRFATAQPVILADGGVYDNLAIEGLLRWWITKQRDERVPRKVFIIAIHAAPPTEYAAAQNEEKLPPLVRQILNAFDVMSNHRSALSRALFEETTRYGITIAELHSVHVVQNDGNPSDVNPTASDLVRLRAELGAIGWLPNANQRAQLINAGILATGHQAKSMSKHLNSLLEMEYVETCADLVDEEKEYCWPQRWLTKNPFNGPLDHVFSQLQDDKHRILSNHAVFLQQGLEGADKTLEDGMIQATCKDTVRAVDYGLIDWAEGFDSYQKANLSAPKRGVHINRVFIIPEPLLKRPKQLKRYVQVMFDQINWKTSAQKELNESTNVSEECQEAGSMTIKVALQRELMKQDKATMSKYNGMVLFEYTSGLRWLLEEVVKYEGEPSFTGRFYALRSYIAQPKDESNTAISDRSKFLTKLNKHKAVCGLPRFPEEKPDDLLADLQKGKLCGAIGGAIDGH